MAKSPTPDHKARALEERGVLNLEPERIKDERFGPDEFFDPQDMVQVKYEMVRRVHSDGATVTEATAAFGFSRPTFYHAQRALAEDGIPGLLPKRPGPRGAHKLTAEVMRFVEELHGEDSALRAPELSRRIRERFGVSVHPRSIERALVRREKKRQESR